ncbi:preprotein translocase subunit SecY [Streptomyces sp. TRM64462]|uniref:preprotein translocase subunit SecY n=1 Tax=Streptomyces sp. TRM64462 TaxID=2741726 RepID=UPI0015866A85|nr:preprotein translocase subunit SecY [Streptomyces sp. TRM64462]
MFIRAFQVPEVRRRLLVTLLVITLFRLGQTVPLPGVDSTALAATDPATGQLLGLLDLLSGGGLAKLSVLALGVLPVIAAHYVVGLGGLLIPGLRALAEADQAAHARLARSTRCVAVLVSAALATVVVRMTADGRPPLAGTSTAAADASVLYGTGALAQITMVVCMTGGTAVVMWLSAIITDRGLGEGLSILLLAQVAAVFPGQVWNAARKRGDGLAGMSAPLVLLVALALVTALFVTVRQSERRVPVQYAKRMIGRRSYGGSAAYVPVRGGQGGFAVMIPASLLFLLPAPPAPWILAAYVLLVFAYAFLRGVIAFDADEVAGDLQRGGGFVPGIRQGRQTVEYLAYIRVRIVLAAALGMTVVALIPVAALALPGLYTDNAVLGVTALLIVARVVLGTALPLTRQIESWLLKPGYFGRVSSVR